MIHLIDYEKSLKIEEVIYERTELIIKFYEEYIECKIIRYINLYYINWNEIT